MHFVLARKWNIHDRVRKTRDTSESPVRHGAHPVCVMVLSAMRPHAQVSPVALAEAMVRLQEAVEASYPHLEQVGPQVRSDCAGHSVHC